MTMDLKEVRDGATWIFGREDSKCKGSEVGACLEGFQNSNGISVGRTGKAVRLSTHLAGGVEGTTT